MYEFCVEKITCPSALLASHGVLTSRALQVSADAKIVADLIEQQARNRAELLLNEARNQAHQKINDICREAVEKALQLQCVMEKARDDFYVRSEPMVLALAQGLFERMTGELAPDEKIKLVLNRLRKEAPPKLSDAVLRLNPDDMQFLDASLVEWELQEDNALPRATCRLEAGSGEWLVSFDMALSALLEAFSKMQSAPSDA